MPYSTRIACATVATAWPAAGFGALVIWVAGDFSTTGTLWIFGWPFLVQLLATTGLHLLAVGAGARFGVPPLVPGVVALDRALTRHDPHLAGYEPEALRTIVRFPVWDTQVGIVLAVLVTAGCAVVERLAAGPGSPNVNVILRGGLYATALYAAANLALGELLTRPACRTLRRAAAARGLEPYDGFVLASSWRIAAMVLPMIVALVVAVEIGLSPRAGTLPYAALIALSALYAVALNWLQYENSRSAVRELGNACRELAEGREGGLITGSIEPLLLEMAREFTAAARRVGADRRDSGERYRAVFEAALDCIISIDHRGRIIEFNPAAEQTFGYARDEVIGRSLAETIIPPRLRDAHARGLTRHLQRGESRIVGKRIEIPAMRADGSEFPAEIAITRIRRDGPPTFTGHLRDITDRKRAEEALTASKRRVEEEAEIAAALLRLAETIDARLNQPDMMVHVSRLTCEALGCDSSSIFVWDEGRRAFVLRANAGSRPEVIAEIEQVDFTPAAFPMLGKLQGGEQVEVEDVAASELFQPALARRWSIAAMLATPIMRGERAVGVVVNTYRERCGPFTLKQRRLARGVAHAAALALENARLIGDLQAANRLKTDFVSTMSHELRTPLNVILGFCEMARDPEVAPQEREACHERIETAGRALLELIESTLEVGRLESGREEMRIEPLRLGPFWAKLGEECAAMPRPREVALAWNPVASDLTLMTDRRKLAIVVRNLVSNALKFTDRGFVRAEALAGPERLVLRVSDSGIGIQPQDLEKIFEMFSQGDGSDSRRFGGVGLGLHIVRRFVQLLGGTVAVESTPGQGSTFTVSLPRRDALPEVRPPTAEEPRPAGALPAGEWSPTPAPGR